MANAVTRRSLLALLGVGVGAVAAGCDGGSAPTVSTSSPTPTTPAVPNGSAEPSGPSEPPVTQPVDTTLLEAALERAQTLSATCAAITGADGWHARTQAQVQTALDEQVRVLTGVLDPTAVTTAPGDRDTSTAAGGPGDQESGTASADDQAPTTAGDDRDATTATVSPRERAAADLRALGRDCLEDVTPEALATVADASADDLPMLLAIAAQRGATASIFGQDPQWAELAGPTGEAAAPLLDVYRPAVYGFEVLAARASGEERERFEAVLTALRAVTRQLTQLAGDSASPAPLGYGIPEGTGGNEGRAALAGDLLAALQPSIMTGTPEFTGDLDAVAGSVRLLAEAVALAQPWRPVAAFPGMQVAGG